MRISTRKRNGAATVEFCVTLPLYLIIVFGVLFFGGATFVDQEMNLARAYATFNPGRDSDGELNTRVLSTYIGQLNVLAKSPRKDPAAVVSPMQDLDQDGEPDKYVDIEISPWLRPDPFNAPTPKNEDLFANFRHDDSVCPPTPNANQLWLSCAKSIVNYSYTPDFSRFIYGERPLTPGEYITYQLGGTVPTTLCRDCHASAIPENNERWTANIYRATQMGAGTLPQAGQEEKLWNHIKVEDMKVLLQIAAGERLDVNPPLPPADIVTDDGQNLVKRDVWDTRYVCNYDVLQGLEQADTEPECDPDAPPPQQPTPP